MRELVGGGVVGSGRIPATALTIEGRDTGWTQLERRIHPAEERQGGLHEAQSVDGARGVEERFGSVSSTEMDPVVVQNDTQILVELESMHTLPTGLEEADERRDGLASVGRTETTRSVKGQRPTDQPDVLQDHHEGSVEEDGQSRVWSRRGSTERIALVECDDGLHIVG